MPSLIARSVFATRAVPKKSVVFLGSPSVAASVLQRLLSESKKPECPFELNCVVSQPDKPARRQKNLVPTPVSSLAIDHALPLLTPDSARDETFLEEMERIKPDLCVTAAYGNFLPKRFLRCPEFGTLNIHPSLLPKYRGAAPVNRALQDGVAKTGVSVALTVLEMDAGPILASKEMAVDQVVQAPELLSRLFDIGTDLLIEALPSVFDGSAVFVPQNPEEVSHAPKMTMAESYLDFCQTAAQVHNKVRAFKPWPGTRAKFRLFNSTESSYRDLELIVVETSLPQGESFDFEKGICIKEDRLLVQCGEGSVLEILSVQRPGKRATNIKDFKNGLSKRTFLTLP